MDNFSAYYSKAAAICSREEKCSSEVLKKLVDWGADTELADEILLKLIQEKFIDDTRYACAFVKDKFRFNKWGRVKISYMLRQKEISTETINLALEEINDEDYLEILTKLLQDKERKTTAKNKFDKKAKLLRFAQSHGFENDLIFKILSSIEKNNRD